MLPGSERPLDQQPLSCGTDAASDTRYGLPSALRHHLSGQLQAFYAGSLGAPPPRRILDLIDQLEATQAQQSSADTSSFRDDLIAALPGLRAFAKSLTVNLSWADDLVQETVLKAWTHQHRFQPGSNLTAWLFTILRNQFYTECRKTKREVEDANGDVAAKLIVLPSQEHGIELQKVWSILAKLPPMQREALLLVAGEGLTYEAAAALVGTQTGTMKSRVSRARAFLAGSLGMTEERLSA